MLYACRVYCRRISNDLDTTIQTVDSTTFNLTAQSLSPYTTYMCCVEATYTDSSENSSACSTATTMEGGQGMEEHFLLG